MQYFDVIILQKSSKMAFEVRDVIEVIISEMYTVSVYISLGFYF
jgi:hypothetical protein